MNRRWSAEQAREWYRRQPLPLGCNFLPSTAINSTEMWQAATLDEATIDKELALAAHTGFNSCRIFLQYLVWQDDPSGFKKRLEHFLSIAAQHNISVMPILLDDCAFAGKEPYPGPQQSLVPGIHNSGWTPSPGPSIADNHEFWPHLETYIKDLLTTFSSDPRILLWDLYNEPGNNNRGAKSLPLLEQAFVWAREVNPSQPLSAGSWLGSPETDQRSLELSDVITFHLYAGVEKMRALIAELKNHGRPLICTEWMARTLDSLLPEQLPVFAEEQVGSYLWGLVAGRTQTYFPWGSPEGAPEPELWFHDLYHSDGSPYREDEIALLQHYGTLFLSSSTSI